jgi:hypothetical protein
MMAANFVTDISQLSKATQDVLASNATGYGLTPQQYLDRRGGVNPLTHKYGDSYNPNMDLTDEEYTAAIAGLSADKVGGAINSATRTKQTKYLLSNPNATITEKTAGVDAGILQSTDYTFDPTGNIVYKSGSGLKTSTQLAADEAAAGKQAERQSAYDLLYSEFKQYGLESLVTPLKGLITSGASPDEFTIKLRETPEYQKRFSANKARIANGFAAINEATYLGLEDKYQSIMQNYGLPASYYAKGDLGVQEGFTNLIAGNVDPMTLEDRILEGKKLTNSTKETLAAAKAFYPSLTDGDILAYTLDPKNALSDIKRKVTAAEIGGAQMGSGLTATAAGAEGLAGAGVTGAQYLQASPFIAEAAQRGSQLADIYGKNSYNQTTAEAEALNLAGGAQATAQRKKLIGLETAAFSGSSGVGALGRDKSIYGAAFGQSGQY